MSKQNTPHVALYARVSSRNQSTRSQEPDMKRWAEAQAEPVVWYRDKQSGKTMNRPAWNRLERDVALGRVSRIVVWRLDRLGRTCAGLTALFEDLQRRGVGFGSLRDNIDLDTASGRLMAHVLASVASYESEVISERTRAGQAVARANGKTWGGSQPGVRWKVQAEQIETIKRMQQEGKSKSAMVRATSLSRPTVYSVLGEIHASTST